MISVVRVRGICCGGKRHADERGINQTPVHEKNIESNRKKYVSNFIAIKLYFQTNNCALVLEYKIEY